MQWVSQSEAQGISCLSCRIVEACTRGTNRSGAFSMTAKTISEIYVIRPISCFAVLWLIPSESRVIFEPKRGIETLFLIAKGKFITPLLPGGIEGPTNFTLAIISLAHVQ